ncbi:MAG TPA: FtsX-like permease family protein [Micromonosporaceae bacterium]|nr:FtsX-like permease family protein [Micromonosporaceae bacterium]
MLRATFASLLARKLRLILSGLAVVLGVMFVSGAFVLTDTLGRSFEGLFSTVYSQTDVQVAGKPKIEVDELEGAPIPANVPADLVERIEDKVPGVADAVGLAEADGARVIGKNGKVIASLGPPRLGANWTGESDMITLRPGSKAPTAENEIAMNAGLAKTGGFNVGDEIAVLTLEPKKTFKLVGIFGYSNDRDSIGGATVVAFTTPVAQQLMLGEKDVYSAIRVKAAAGVTPEELRDRIAAELGPDYVVKTGDQLATETTDSFRRGLGFFNNILLGFAGVALFVGIFLILNTFSIIVAQRTRELALMRAVGASRRQVIGSVLVEALVIGLVASVLGLGAGIGVGALLAFVFGQMAGGLALAGIGVPVAAVVSAFTVGLLVTLVAAVLPAIRASRIPPVAALQDSAIPDKPLTRVTIAGALTLTAGGAALALGLSGNAGDATLWTVLAGVLVSFVGVALLTPLLARPVVSVLGRLFSWSVPGKLGRLNSGRNPRRTAITAAALMVGIALVIGVNVILTSATKSFDRLAANQVHAEIYISGEQSGPLPPTFDAAVLDRAGSTPGVAKVTGAYLDRAIVNGTKPDFVVAVHDIAAARDIFALTPAEGSLDTLGEGQLVLDAESATQIGGVHAGDRVSIQLTRGEAETYTVAGIYQDNDVISGIFVPESAAKNFAVPQPFQAFVQLAPGASITDVLPRIEALLADSPEVSASDRSAFIAQQTRQFDTILTMIQILLALAILIAVLGIVNTLALSVLERTRELGLLRAIGLRRAQTMRMITVESMVISVFGALLGVAVGTGLGTAVVRALRDEGFTDLAFPWSQMALYLVLAALVGVVAAVLPAIRAARVDVLNAIAYE